MMASVNYIHYAPEYILCWVVLFAFSIYVKSTVLFFVAVFLFVTLLFFFRGWMGNVAHLEKGHMVCPCDGKVLDVVMHPDRKYVQIAIFLNVHNVHIQYVPCHGIIKSVTHKEGEFHPAYMLQKSALNERTETIITSEEFGGDVVIVQIAGLVARRIVSFLKKGEQVHPGKPLGLIKLGSRVDVWIPFADDLDVLVKKDDRVHIGDVLARRSHK